MRTLITKPLGTDDCYFHGTSGMITRKKIYSVPIIRIGIILITLLLQFNLVNAQSRHEPDTGEKVNFCRTDSIFSFRSRKGCLPSPIHNSCEQAAAPFHFNAKQWLITSSLLGYVCGRQIVSHYKKTHQGTLQHCQDKSDKKPEITFFQFGDQVGFTPIW